MKTFALRVTGCWIAAVAVVVLIFSFIDLPDLGSEAANTMALIVIGFVAGVIGLFVGMKWEDSR